MLSSHVCCQCALLSHIVLLSLFSYFGTCTHLHSYTQPLKVYSYSHIHTHIYVHTHTHSHSHSLCFHGARSSGQTSLPPFRCYCFHPSLRSEILLLLNSKWKPMVQVWIVECTAFTANGTPVLSKSQRLNVTFYQFGVAAIRHFPDLLRLKRKRRRMRKRDSEK